VVDFGLPRNRSVIVNNLPLVGVDPGDEVADAGVDAILVGAGAAIAPRDEANEGLGGGVDDRAARVPLARVLATGRKAGADHVVGDARGAVGRAAGGAADHWDGDLAQGCGKGAGALRSGAPASGDGRRSRRRVAASGGQGDVADGGAGRDGGREAPQGDVVVGGAVDVAGVDKDLPDRDLGAARGALEGASADFDGRGRLANGAVGSGDDGVGVEQDTSAEVRAALGEGDDEGEVAGRGSLTANNLDARDTLLNLLSGELKGLGGGSGRDQGRQDRQEGSELGGRNHDAGDELGRRELDGGLADG